MSSREYRKQMAKPTCNLLHFAQISKVAAPDPARDIGVQIAALKLKQPNLG